MRRASRHLTPDEAEVWKRVASTVTPMHHRPAHRPAAIETALQTAPAPPPPRKLKGRMPPPPPPRPVPPQAQRPLDHQGLDASWDRKLARGVVSPDFTLDLHGHTLDSAHVRLDHGIALALAQGARVILLITGRARPSDDHAGRSSRRGAIRAKYLDWLAHGPHAGRIAAIRAAHPRHGGHGAVYIVLKRLKA